LKSGRRGRGRWASMCLRIYVCWLNARDFFD
jgi:hypothetical protein